MIDQAADVSSAVVRLSDAGKGDRGVVVQVICETGPASGGVEQAELERRLLEIGFVEGARIELLHEGFIGRDPIAVKLDDMRVALRRREARGVLIALDPRERPRRVPAKAKTGP
jgi:ferrous iron transport protein A